MTSDKEQNCMRVCYQHWEKNNSEHLNSEKMSIITYAMLLEITNKSSNEDTNRKNYIERAKKLYNQGLQNGWFKTH